MKENNEIILTPGYFLLNDGSEISPSSINNENKGKVIGYILDNSGNYSGRHIMIAINASSYPMYWGDYDYLYGVDIPGLINYKYPNGSTELYRDKNGKSNTQIVADYCNSQGWSLSDAGPAFNYCKTYNPGYRDSEWYLPSAGELKLFYNNRNKFREDCNTAGISTNMSSDYDCWFWSSTEYSDIRAWLFRFSDSDLSYNNTKDYSRYVLPFLSID